MSRQHGAALNLPSYAADPTVPTLRSGDAYWNNASSKARVYNGTAWQDWSANSAATVDVPVLTPGTESSITLASPISLNSIVQVRRKSDRVVVPTVVVRIIDATHIGVTSDVVTTAAQYEVVYGAPVAATVQVTSIIDQVESNYPDYAGVMGTNWVSHVGLNLVLPAGVPMVLYYSTAAFYYQNSQVANSAVSGEWRFINSSGTQVGLGLPKRVFTSFSTASNGVAGFDVLYRVSIDPLAAQDIFTVQSWGTAAGAGTKSQVVSGQLFGVGAPQEFWAEVGI